MDTLETLEKCLFDESAVARQSGDYDAVRRYIGLAERVHGLRAEIASLGGPARLSSPEDTLDTGMRGTERYPRFWIENDVLRKMGMGRDGRTPYVHGIPRDQYNRVVEALKSQSIRGDSFEVRSFVMSLGMPDYHPYIVLSVMEDVGLLASPKRGLMKFTNRTEFQQRVNTVWSTIVSRVAPDR